jgi:hypothetical protein
MTQIINKIKLESYFLNQYEHHPTNLHNFLRLIRPLSFMRNNIKINQKKDLIIKYAS